MDAPSYQWSRWVFTKAIGIVYLSAFLSLWWQVSGLYGAEGILPYAGYLDAIEDRVAGGALERLMACPTLLWLDRSDLMIHGICALGALASGLVIAGVGPAVSLAACWAGYLSLAAPGRVFLSFQWDGLLLEAGLIAIVLAPWGIRPGLGARPPTRAALWLAWWLVFRLMFWSGAVKLFSGDETWRALTALEHHHLTQPLPMWTAWSLHKLPVGAHRFMAAATFVIELLLPFLIFFKRGSRHAAAAGFVALMLGVMASGNYGFFNWLTIALCVLLVDDRALLGLIPGRWRPAPDHNPFEERLRREWIVAPLVVASLFMSATRLQARLADGDSLLGPQRSAYQALTPLRSFNSYGLFAVMTTERREIRLEGSLDGQTWEPYTLPFQPGPVDRRPPLIPLHMPRLDWQMWFAALGTADRNAWMGALMRRLMEGSGPVTGLFSTVPFDGQPPRYMRATIRDYTFSDDWLLQSEGAWWIAGDTEIYAGPVRARE